MDERIYKAVIKQLGGKESLEDVYNHGADGGFSGFIYHSDTIEFFRKNKKHIVMLAEDMSNDLGEDILSMINSFNCLKDYELSNSQIGKVLYGKFSDSDDNTQIMNALSWFALEEVARYVCESEDNL